MAMANIVVRCVYIIVTSNQSYSSLPKGGDLASNLSSTIVACSKRVPSLVEQTIYL